jgi:hypothetical protein
VECGRAIIDIGKDCSVLHQSYFETNENLTISLVQLDAGIHPAHSGLASLPFFDEIDPGSVDVLLVSQ